MKCRIEIDMDNAAFDEEPGYELTRILYELSRGIDISTKEKRIRDINGNTVGSIKIIGKR
jgi:hypothetical protein